VPCVTLSDNTYEVLDMKTHENLAIDKWFDNKGVAGDRRI
jgi:hypothetical protein